MLRDVAELNLISVSIFQRPPKAITLTHTCLNTFLSQATVSASCIPISIMFIFIRFCFGCPPVFFHRISVFVNPSDPLYVISTCNSSTSKYCSRDFCVLLVIPYYFFFYRTLCYVIFFGLYIILQDFLLNDHHVSHTYT